MRGGHDAKGDWYLKAIERHYVLLPLSLSLSLSLPLSPYLVASGPVIRGMLLSINTKSIGLVGVLSWCARSPVPSRPMDIPR